MFNGSRGLQVDHDPNVGPIDAHPERVGGDHHVEPLLGEGRADSLALLGFEPGVRCPTPDHHLERAGSLATGLDRSPVGARFEYQDVAACPRPLLQERT